MKLRMPRYRFTFFQRQFLSHLFIALLLLVPLAFGFYYFAKHSILYKNKSEELLAATKVAARALTREERTKAEQQLATYKLLLTERKISIIALDRKGDVVNIPALATTDWRNKALLDRLRKQIFHVQNDAVFLLDSVEGVSASIMVAPKLVRPLGDKDYIYLFAVSPVQGFSGIVGGMNRTVLAAGGCFLVLVLAISYWLSRSMSRRVRRLQLATRGIAEGDYAVRLEEKRTDELGDLSRDFNSMAQQLQEASEKLARFEARRQQFMSDVSHELRTPLTSIRGLIEGFRNNLVAPEEQAKYYSIIEKETFRLMRLINELMDMERIRTNQVQLDHEWHRAADILEVVGESLELLAAEKKLRLEVQCADTARIYGDYDRLMQIMINLVKNAIQFSDYGTVRLSAEEQDTHTVLEVADQGRGMTRVQVEQMWDRFYKADPSRVKEKSETGLGLSIVKQLVEAHGGTIEVRSEPGLGTTIRLRLPKAAAETDEPQAG